MSSGVYSGVVYGYPTPLGGVGGGVYTDSNGNAYLQFYYGTPGIGGSTGYSNNLEAFLTGTSVAASLGGSSMGYNVGMGEGGSGVGAGSPGVGVTYGWGPFNRNDLPEWMQEYIPDPDPNPANDQPPAEPNQKSDDPGDPPPPLPDDLDKPPNPPKIDPIVLDVNGLGIDLTAVASSSAYFDYSGNGFAIQTGWIGQGEGLLVVAPADGATITLENLLGVQSGSAVQDLRAMDENGDGVIDATDTAFAELKVWVDSGDGVSNSGELFSLADLGITSIDLATTPENTDINGNTVVETGSFTMNVNGEPTSRSFAEVLFSVDTVYSIYSPPAGFETSPEAFALPQLQGHGTLPDLRVAMTLDADLLSNVKSLILSANTMTLAEMRNALEGVVQEWAGVDGIAPDSRGEYVNARHLGVIYAFYGIDEAQNPVFAGNPNWNSGPAYYEPLYEKIIDSMLTRFISQISISQALSGVALEDVLSGPYVAYTVLFLNPETNSFVGSAPDLISNLAERAPADASESNAYWQEARNIFAMLKTEGSTYSSSLVRAIAGSGLSSTVQALLLTEFSEWRIGSTGNDAVSGTSRADMLLGLAGDDALSGQDGDDTYFYARGDGNDSITEGMNKGSADKLVFTDINPGDVTLARNGIHVTLVIAESSPGAGDGGSVLLNDELDELFGRGVDQIVFADGTTWTRATLRTMLLAQASTDGADTIYGFNVNDTITAGMGDDTVDGAGGDDTYIYARGDGNDTITELMNNGTADKLTFTDINPGDVTLVRNGNHVTLVIAESSPGAGDGGSVLLKDGLDELFGQGVDQIVFADGTTWTRATLRAMLLDMASTDGADTIYGFNVNDTIVAGKGNDIIDGAGGDDTYMYSRGDGDDTITEGMNGGTTDKLVFTDINPGDVTLVRNGIHVTLVIAESAPGAGDGGSVLLRDELDELFSRGVDQIIFADGTTWTRATLRSMLLDMASTDGADTVYGFNVNDTIVAGKGNDIIDGAGGDDTYMYSRGDGNDTITEGMNGGIADKLIFTDINPGDVALVRNGNHVTLVIGESSPGAGDGGSVQLRDELDEQFGRGVDQIVFADGTTWTRATLRTMLVSSAGTNGNDTINGTSASDMIAGMGGNDVINGAGGDDTYIYTRGDGNDTITETMNNGAADKLVFTNINPGEVVLVRNGIHVTLVIAESSPGAGDGGGVLLKDELDEEYSRGVDQIVFADGTTWTRATMRGMLLDMASTDGADTVYGFNVNDTIIAGKGNDIINGYMGNDTYIYARGDGNDTITEGLNAGTADKLVFTDINPEDVTLVRNGIHVTLVIAESSPGAGDGGSVLLKDELDENYSQGVDQIVFVDGTTWTRSTMRDMLLDIASTDGADAIYGFNTNDTIIGGRGDDTLSGNMGNDTYLYARGDGNDTITENINSGTADRLVFSDINPGEVTLVRNGNHVTLVIAESSPGAGDSGTIVLKDSLASNFGQGVDQVVFADGTTWSRADMNAHLSTQAMTTLTGTVNSDQMSGTSGSDLIVGYAGSDRLDSQGGSDILFGGDGDDQLYGQTGDDTLYGQNGNDTLDGGAGNDTLSGGTGNDTYLFGRGSNADVVNNYDASGVENDRVAFGTGIAEDQIWMQRNGNDLQLTLFETSDTLTMRNWYDGAEYRVDSFDLGNGKRLLENQVDTLVSAMAAFAPPAAGQASLPADYQAALTPLIAASWK